MALRKPIENADGSITEYHKISRVDIYLSEGEMDVYTQSYVNAFKREDGKIPSFCNVFRLKYDYNNIPNVAEIYGVLKNSEFFIGAEDLL